MDAACDASKAGPCSVARTCWNCGVCAHAAEIVRHECDWLCSDCVEAWTAYTDYAGEPMTTPREVY